MAWVQLELYVKEEQCSAIESILTAAGACAFTFLDAKDQPIYEVDSGTMTLWNGTHIQALFTEDTDMSKVVQLVQALIPEALTNHQIHILENKDWEKECLQDFKPIQFGQRLWVCPSWCSPPDDNAVNILLDPGCGFGTGSHPTTAMCLSWLAKQNLADKKVIDYGCGSGILAIASALLGAEHTLGVDIDAQAIQASQQNAIKNQLNESAIQILYPQDIPLEAKDILLANILSGPLIKLACTLASLIKPAGCIVLSGILSSQSEDVIAAYTPWFENFEQKTEDDWVLLTAIRNNNDEL